jgi:SAM-dependent methyltransferase
MRQANFPDSPLKVRLREIARRVLRLVGGRSYWDVEYDFAYRNICGERLRILDIGGCDSLLPLVFARAGHRVTVYDFRPYPERHPNLTIIHGDFLENQLPSCSFDAIIMVSKIEHIGTGEYGAPERPDADFEVMRELHRLIADGGRVVLTFPFSERIPPRETPQSERWYTVERLQKLFEGWFVLNVEFWIPMKRFLNRWVKWEPATLYEAAHAYEHLGEPDLACFVLSNRALEWWQR